MKRSSRIQPLKKLASRHEQQAARVLGQSRTQLEEKQNRLQELLSYRQEYQQGFHRQAERGIAGVQLQAYQSFMQQLDEAIRQQRVQVEQAEQACNSVAKQWRETHVRTQALDKTIQRFRAEENQQAEKRIQRDADERVSRAYYSTRVQVTQQ